MKLLLERIHSSVTDTLGILFIDGKFFCYTLEDEYREVKVMAETRIPAGTYSVALTFSQRFERVMPEIQNVPNFTGIRIHAGNTEKDTAGCPLVGYVSQVSHTECSRLGYSRVAFDELFKRMSIAKGKGEDISITIIDRDRP